MLSESEEMDYILFRLTNRAAKEKSKKIVKYTPIARAWCFLTKKTTLSRKVWGNVVSVGLHSKNGGLCFGVSVLSKNNLRMIEKMADLQFEVNKLKFG